MNASPPLLLALPGGAFVMGNDTGRPDERPAHTVILPAVLAAVAPVTNADYAAYATATGAAPAPFLGEERFALPGQPVVGVSWFEAVAYCDWLSNETGLLLRLPTEAEREYSARGGLEALDWPWAGDNEDFVAWVNSLQEPHEPTERCANTYGLRCTAENVHEWCSDWYDARYYEASPQDSPAGPDAGVRRASRGGSWRHREKTTRVSARSSIPPSFQYSDYGFRVYGDPS